MFDRLGDFLRDYIDEDDQDIFSSPQEQIEKEKSTQNFSQDNQSTEKEKNAYTTEKIKTEKSKEKFQVIDNNHNVNGDVTLVTNVQKNNDCFIITTGKFIFDIKGNSDAKKVQ